jgi:hypothetical protein
MFYTELVEGKGQSVQICCIGTGTVLEDRGRGTFAVGSICHETGEDTAS